MIPVENDAVPVATVNDAGKSRWLSKAVWGIVLLAALFEGVDGFTMIRAAESAPQQAAAAAMACFYVIVMYVVARSVDALTR